MRHALTILFSIVTMPLDVYADQNPLHSGYLSELCSEDRGNQITEWRKWWSSFRAEPRQVQNCQKILEAKTINDADQHYNQASQTDQMYRIRLANIQSKTTIENPSSFIQENDLYGVKSFSPSGALIDRIKIDDVSGRYSTRSQNVRLQTPPGYTTTSD